jgi:hypothetical protein
MYLESIYSRCLGCERGVGFAFSPLNVYSRILTLTSNDHYYGHLLKNSTSSPVFYNLMVRKDESTSKRMHFLLCTSVRRHHVACRVYISRSQYLCFRLNHFRLFSLGICSRWRYLICVLCRAHGAGPFPP